MEPLVEVTGLAKRYDGFALEDVSLAVEPGLIVGLIGQNGAGKTTVLKSILGLVRPDAGTIRLFGQDAATGGRAIDACKERIGVVLDTCAFLATMRVADVARLGKAAYRRWDAPRFDQLCGRFGLAPKTQVKSLSRGMGMKLSFAFALAHRPDLLVLDEATAGLDPMARGEMLDLLRTFMEDEAHGILMATHITSDLEKAADEVICIDEGRILFDMPKEGICDAAGIAHCRAADIEAIAASEYAAANRAALKVLHRGLGTDVLVPDRVGFARAFPDIALERASVEGYMTMTLKGEHL